MTDEQRTTQAEHATIPTTHATTPTTHATTSATRTRIRERSGVVTNRRTDADVVIVGAGPTGLMLAGDLAEAGVRTIVLESDLAPRSHPRAWGLQPRTQETLALRGVLDDVAEGIASMEGTSFGGIGVDYTGLETPFPRFLHAPQTRTEQVLRERAVRAGADLRYGTAARGLSQAEDIVTIETEASAGTSATTGTETDPRTSATANTEKHAETGTAAGPEIRAKTGATADTVSARYVVGCDGGHSAVRRAAGIRLTGTDALSTALFADVELADPADAFALRGARSAEGMLMVLRRPPTMFRVIALRFRAPAAENDIPATEADLRDEIRTIAGRDVEFTSVAWLSRFTDAARIAERYRSGRVLLAGDAAHIHSPFGGQGLNLGVQDAANLSWRLVRAVDGDAEALDGYELERKPVAEGVLENTRVQTQLLSARDATVPLRDAFVELATLPEGNRRLAEQLSGLGIRYEPESIRQESESEEDPFAGRFLPAGLLRTAGLRELGALLDPRGLTEITTDERVLLTRADGYVAESRPR